MDIKQIIMRQIECCMEIEGYVCGIFAFDDETQLYFKELVLELIRNYPSTFIRTAPFIFAFGNGSCIKILKFNRNTRGQRYNGVIIDDRIPLEDRKEYILPYFVLLRNENHTINASCINLVDVELELRKREDGGNNKMITDKGLELIHTFNDGNRKIMLYNAAGFNSECIWYDSKYINRTRETYLNIRGTNRLVPSKEKEYSHNLLEKEFEINILINTEIYDGYNIKIEDGILYVTLFEIETVKPVFKERES